MNGPLWNVPNLLSLSRLPLAAAVFACIDQGLWGVAFGLFAVAAATDWVDGWWARRYGPLTAVGRALDPLTDKVLLCGAFVYLLSVPGAGVRYWMVTLVVAREVVVTGVRGMVEATGKSFGADGFGKLKTGLQCAVVLAVLGLQVAHERAAADVPAAAGWAVAVLLYGTVFATVASGVRYVVRAGRILGR
jgi:CDP-diacylglycerol---glycerol-3-phosphate 3-phosphatidyltransferase